MCIALLPATNTLDEAIKVYFGLDKCVTINKTFNLIMFLLCNPFNSGIVKYLNL